MTTLKRLALAAALAALLVSASPAQEFRGSITGRVTDAQDAVVPNVKIIATKVDTGSRYETISTADGQFTLTFLAPGTYTLSAEVPGFKRYSRDGIQVSAADRVGVDIRLDVGDVAETVAVTAETPLLQTATASVGSVVTSAQIDTTPLNGRSPLTLARLTGGVVVTADGQAPRPFDTGRQAQIAMGGARSGQNELLVDGSPAMDSEGVAGFVPSVDAVAEVKVETFQTDAAYGHTGGGTVNMVTKSGTNSFHGALYAYNQSSALAATPFFTNRAGQQRQKRKYNQYGASVGGPIYIPKIIDARNKVLFFFNYEGIKVRQGAPNVLTVPTEAQRRGDFSALLRLGANYQLYDPLTGVREGSRVRRQPFVGNIIPVDRFSPVARRILEHYPLPNLPGRADGRDNYISPDETGTDDFHSALGRLDFNLSDRQKIYFNYRHNNRDLRGANNLNVGNPAVGYFLNEFNWGSTVDHVYAVRPTLVLNNRLTWARKTEVRLLSSEGFDFSTLGFPASLLRASQKPSFPRIQMNPFRELGNPQVSRLSNPYDTFQIFASQTKVAGRHTFKTGADLRLNRFSSTVWLNAAGVYTFGSGWTNGPLDNSAAPPLGHELSAFLLGLPTDGSFPLNTSQTSQAGYYALFLQDDFRVRPNLMLNLGIRYEHDVATTERYNRSTRGFDFTTPSPISAAAAAAYAQAPIPEVPVSQFRTVGGLQYASAENRNLYETSGYFSPRIGFAWTPSALGGKTVIRAGTGVFFFPIILGGVDQTGFSISSPLVPSLDGFLTPNATLSNPFPSGLLQPLGAQLGLSANLGQAPSYTHQDRLNGYSIRWNFDIQRELPARFVFQVGYEGNHALHQETNRQLNFVPRQYLSTSPFRDQPVIDRLTANVANPFRGLIPGTGLNGTTVRREQLLLPYPHFTGLVQRALPEGSSYYHSLQVRIEKRLSAGVQFLGVYTWSKLIERLGRLNDSDPFLTKEISLSDRPQRLVLSGSWDLPFGRGKALGSSVHPVVNHVIGGWNVNGNYSWQIERPLEWGNVIYFGGDINLDPHNVDRAFDTSRFNTNSAQQLDRNIRTFPRRFGNLRWDSVNNVDVSIIKNIPIRENLRLQYRCEFYNAFNHPLFGSPNLSPTSGTAFATITGEQRNFPRAIQMALRLTW